jgi:drug/metabolite transporter (DMT)-like permease
MAAISLSLLAALCWGSADFIGGVLSRRNPVAVVLLIVFGVGLALALAFVALTGPALPSGRAIAFALVGGALGSIGLGLFYLAMSLGKLGVVAPIAASGVAIPVVVGLAGGDSLAPIVAVGLGLTVTGIILTSIESSEEEIHEDRAGGLRVVGIALLAAVGLGSFLAFAEVPYEESVPWTLVLTRSLAVPVLVVAVIVGRLARPSGRDGSLAAVGGTFDVAATAFVGLALESGALSIVAVLSSLYPVVAIFLAFAILRERLRPLQAVGAALALSGVVLIAAG